MMTRYALVASRHHRARAPRAEAENRTRARCRDTTRCRQRDAAFRAAMPRSAGTRQSRPRPRMASARSGTQPAPGRGSHGRNRNAKCDRPHRCANAPEAVRGNRSGHRTSRAATDTGSTAAAHRRPCKADRALGQPRREAASSAAPTGARLGHSAFSVWGVCPERRWNRVYLQISTASRA